MHIILSFFTVLICLVGGASATGAELAASPLGDVDLYGTHQISLRRVKAECGGDLDRLRAAVASGNTDTFFTLQEKIIARISKMGRFAAVTVSTITYFTKGHPVYATVDVVDEVDRATRMNFLPEPDGKYEDPDGLFALWAEYQERGFALLRETRLPPMKEPCPAFHCVFGFEHPDLKRFEEPFRIGAAKNKARLMEILAKDRDPAHRATSAFLLAHIRDGEDLVRALVPAVRDPNEGVRNNTMRVLAYVARFHRELHIPLAPVLEATDYPETTDRNKSLAILDGLAADPANGETILHRVGPRLLRILRLVQPNNHDYAYSILKKISGESFGQRDYVAWEKWMARRLRRRGRRDRAHRTAVPPGRSLAHGSAEPRPDPAA